MGSNPITCSMWLSPRGLRQWVVVPLFEGSNPSSHPIQHKKGDKYVKLNNAIEIDAFQRAINKCKGDVWFESIYGDRLNLKSVLSRYVAFGKLINDEGENLELFCSLPEDECNFYKFFAENPDTLT